MKNHSLLLLVMMVLWIGSVVEARYSGGTGEPNDPYRIATPEDIQQMEENLRDWNKYFI